MTTKTISVFLAILLALILLSPEALARQVEAGADAAAEEEPAWTPAPPDDGTRKLLEEFNSLQRSLQNSRGLHSEHMRFVRSFQERVQQRLSERPDSPYLLAIDAQLAMWLGEDERVDQNFRRLIDITGDVAKYGEAWTNHYRGRNQEKLGEVYAQLMAEAPDATKLRLDWGIYLRQQGEYRRAIEVLEQTTFQPSENPRAMQALAEAQMAEHQFAQALETIDAIPQHVLDQQPAIRRGLEVLREQINEMSEAWTAEQEQRSADAAADDLPRVRLTTSRGPIVVELFEDQAPNTTANFISLVEQDYYDGTEFYRVIPGALIYGGEPVAEDPATAKPGVSNPGYHIPPEHELEGRRRHFGGMIAMERSGTGDAAGSLFYFTLRPMAERDQRNTVFGRVIEGMDVVRTLEKGDTIESAEVTRKRDHEYEVQTQPLPTEKLQTPTLVP